MRLGFFVIVISLLQPGCSAMSGVSATLLRPDVARSWGMWIPVALAFLLGMTVYLIGALRAKKADKTLRSRFWGTLGWIRPSQLGYRYQSLQDLRDAAFVWSCAMFVLSYLIVVVFAPSMLPNGWDFMNAPGLLFVFIGAFVSVWGLANTHMIAVRQRHTFTKFHRLRDEMQTVVTEILKRDRPTNDADENFYMVDYGPRLGEVSRAAIVDDIEHMFQQLATCRQCNTHLIFLPERRLEFVYEHLLQDHDHALAERVSGYLRASEEAIERLDTGLVAVWRSDKIQNEHYIISRNKALEYIVLPQEDRGKNEVAGDITLESNRIDLLYRRAEDYLRDAITPRVTHDENGPCMYFLVAQVNIRCIELIVAGSVADLRSLMTCESFPDGTSSRISLEDGTLKVGHPYRDGLLATGGWVALRLVKHKKKSEQRDVCSVFSHAVRIPASTGAATSHVDAAG